MFLEIGSVFLYFWGAAKLRWARGAQRPVGRGNEPKKTGARSARARTRGQNPLVRNIFLDENDVRILPLTYLSVKFINFLCSTVVKLVSDVPALGKA